MDIKKILQLSIKKLKKGKNGSLVLDAEVLLSHILKTTKEKLYAHPEQKLSSPQLTAYSKLIGRRAKHEPVAYLTGHKEFYDLDFLVNKKVLIPRPETELIVNETINLAKKHIAHSSQLRSQIDDRQKGTLFVFLDIGTGSGCIIISIAKLLTTHYPLQTQLYATDISPAVLKIAKQNAKRHGVEKQIKLLQGNLLEPFLKNYKLLTTNYSLIITANLPYLPTAEWRRTPPDVKKYEPRLALDGGPDGLKYYRQLFVQIKNYSLPTTNYLLIEICPHQAKKISTMAKHYFPKCQVKIKKDLCGHKRLAVIDNLKSI